jgi:pyrroline-5-carboxylate reductase
MPTSACVRSQRAFSAQLRYCNGTMSQLDNKKVAILGTGKMGSILLDAFLRSKILQPYQISATVAHTDRAAALAKQFGVSAMTDNRTAINDADVILIGVKPPGVPDLLAGIASAIKPGALIVSFAASVNTAAMEAALGGRPAVIRAMPNTPSLLGAGITALCRGHHVADSSMELAGELFATVGRTVVVDEKHMDAVTGLSASGPAFIFIILESLAEAGVKVGLPRDIATLLAAQTVYGSAKMVLETGMHPALLKDAVTTPAGCTIDGILELEEGGLRVTLIKAVMRSTQRAKELAQG